MNMLSKNDGVLLVLDLHYQILGDIVRFQSRPFNDTSADRVGVLPGNTKFTLYLLPWKDSPGLWIESDGLGGRYRVPDLDRGLPRILIGQDIVSGRLSSKFCLVFGSDDGGRYSVIPREQAEELMSEYDFRSDLQSGAKGKKTRKHIPGHRYLAGNHVVIYLGQESSGSHLYVRESELSGQASFTEVLKDIHSGEVNHNHGITNSAKLPRLPIEEGSGIWIRRSCKMSLLTDAGPGISTDLNPVEVLESWVKDLLVGEGSAKFRWDQFLCKSFLLTRITEGPIPEFRGLPAVTEFIAEILYWKTLSLWDDTRERLPEPLGIIMTDGRAAKITPELISKLDSYRRTLEVYREGWPGVDRSVEIMKKIGIDPGEVLGKVYDKLVGTNLEDPVFKRAVIEKSKEYPEVCGLGSRYYRTTLHYYQERRDYQGRWRAAPGGYPRGFPRDHVGGQGVGGMEI